MKNFHNLLKFVPAGCLFLASYFLPTSASFADPPKITGSAAFSIDGGGNVTGVAVSAAVGSVDAYSRAFYNVGTNALSSISIGSAATIKCDGNPCNVNATGDITIGSSSGATNPAGTSANPPNIIESAP